MLRRRRSAGTLATTATPQVPLVAVARTVVASSVPTASHRIRLVPHLDNRRSLRFDPISRDVKEGEPPLRIGRFTDRSGLGPAAANALGSNKLAFKSKVVSRAHAEIWAELGGRFFIKDTKSSSGTFLNHVRLSPANTESRPTELRDGDLLQLGVDYQGGTEDIYKCVKIKIEVGREWQTHSNPFNANALKQLKAIALQPQIEAADKKVVHYKSSLPDCCICLFAVTIHQALFIAPCSHAFHFKCIRPLLETHHPAFSCPLCRTFANLDEDVEVEVEVDGEGDADSMVGVTPLVSAVERPGTGDGSSRERDRERERDAGAETEVEPDTGAPRLGSARGRRHPALPINTYLVPQDVVDLTEDADEEMADDEMALPPLPEGSPLHMDVVLEDQHDGSASPVPVPVPGPASGLVPMDEEEEGSGGSALDASDGSGRLESHPKRKR
ncbi:hypothetical protein BKA93DRAFT_730894 [Sparassis latifolia]